MTNNNAHTATLRPHSAAALSSLHITVDELCEAQDSALMQVIAMARLAKAALDNDTDYATGNARHALDAIIKIAALASANLDAVQIKSATPESVMLQRRVRRSGM